MRPGWAGLKIPNSKQPKPKQKTSINIQTIRYALNPVFAMAGSAEPLTRASLLSFRIRRGGSGSHPLS